MSSEAELFIPLDYSHCNRLLYKILKEQSPVTSRTVSLFAHYTSSKGVSIETVKKTLGFRHWSSL